MSDTSAKVWGVLAEFPSASTIYHACEKVRDAGYKNWDAHTPFPVHGLDKAMGLKSTPLPWVVFFMAIGGASGAMLLQWWTSTIAYPVVISGKPLFSWQAYMPITFEVAVLCGALGAFLGILHFSRLPRHNHPIFNSERFAAVTDHKFFVSIEATDGKFSADETVSFLKQLGAEHVETLHE